MFHQTIKQNLFLIFFVALLLTEAKFLILKTLQEGVLVNISDVLIHIEKNELFRK